MCEVHKVKKLLTPYVSGSDVIREGICIECGQMIAVFYGFAGAFIGDEAVAFEEVKDA